MAALDVGHTAEELARVGFRLTEETIGTVPTKYERCSKRWAQLANHGDERIREIADLVKRECETAADEWQKREASEEFIETYMQ